MAVQIADMSGTEHVIERVDPRSRDAYEDLGRTGRRIGPIEELLDVGSTESPVTPKLCSSHIPLSPSSSGARPEDDAKLTHDINVKF
jgi:hypothetical protein